jgi:maleate isomerase
MAARQQSAMLGVILPDDGPFDYEWMHLESWLPKHGLGDLGYRLVRSPADGVMAHDNLMAIGSGDALLPAARDLSRAGAGAVVWACTSGSFTAGRRYAETQARQLAEAAGVPATSTSLALAAAAESIGAHEVDLLSAYSEALTDVLVGFLQDSGLVVREVKILDCLYTEQSFAIDIEAEVASFAAATPGSRRPILVPDTAINTLDLLDRLTDLAGRPVITANQASLWHGVRLLGRTDRNVVDLFRPAA